MNTTMADGAEQRLDAQIADALFGQPGMSKMDVANRVRELRGDGPALLGPREGVQDERARFEAWAQAQSHRGGNIPTGRDAGHPDVYAAPLAQLTWKSWQAALSAQPSPGGQGESMSISDDDRAVLQRLQDALPTAGINGWAKGVEVLERLLRDSLAARQPVGVPADTLRALADRWASDRDYTGSPVDDIRALIDAPTFAARSLRIWRSAMAMKRRCSVRANCRMLMCSAPFRSRRNRR
jgi:hypothetical protein